jgi:hypothetical protein
VSTQPGTTTCLSPLSSGALCPFLGHFKVPASCRAEEGKGAVPTQASREEIVGCRPEWEGDPAWGRL